MRKNTSLELSAVERERLHQFISSGKALARHLKHAQVLLKLADGWQNVQVAQAIGVDERTVIRLKKRFLSEGLEATLQDKPRSGAPPKIDGDTKAFVVATACAKAPTGHARWTLRLLAKRLVELEVVDEISHESIRQILKKTN